MTIFTLARTDGDETKWPAENVHIPHSKRKLNKYVPCLNDDDPRYTSWRSKIGQAIAAKMGQKPTADDFLAEFPPGFRLYFHHTKKTNDASLRQDPYLCGRQDGKKYRSVIEFIEHAWWLLPEVEAEPCRCGYCTGGGIGRTSLVAAPDGSLVRQNQIAQGHSVPFVFERLAGTQKYIGAVVSRPRPRAKGANGKGKGKARPSTDGNDGAPPVETIERMQGVQFVAKLRSQDMSDNRRFRQGEVVWVPIPAITRPGDESSTEAGFTSTTDSTRVLSVESQTIRYWPAVIQSYHYNPALNPPPVISGVGGQGEGSSSSAQRVSSDASAVAHWSYRVRFFRLGCDEDSPSFTENQLLPFLAHQADLDATDSARSGLANMDEFPDMKDLNLSAIRSDWGQVVVTYAAALTIAEGLTNFWCSTNKYKVAPGPDHPETHQWYQGLWWGTERIWLGDFVRVLGSHQHLLSPIADNDAEDGVYPAQGEPNGALFFSIEGLFNDPNSEKNGLMIGRLYEVVDDAPSDDPDSAMQVDEAGPSNTSASVFKVPDVPASAGTSAPGASPLLLTKSGQIFPLPSPPVGKAFRLLHSPEVKITLPLANLAGRYYPSLPDTVDFLPLDTVNGEASLGHFAPPPSIARSMSVLAGGSFERSAEDREPKAYGGVFMGPEERKGNRFEMITDGYPTVKRTVEGNWHALHHSSLPHKGGKRPVIDSDDENDETMDLDNPRFQGLLQETGSDLDAEGEMEIDELDDDTTTVERPRKFARLDEDDTPAEIGAGPAELGSAPDAEVAMEELQQEVVVEEPVVAPVAVPAAPEAAVPEQDVEVEAEIPAPDIIASEVVPEVAVEVEAAVDADATVPVEEPIIIDGEAEIAPVEPAAASIQVEDAVAEPVPVAVPVPAQEAEAEPAAVAIEGQDVDAEAAAFKGLEQALDGADQPAAAEPTVAVEELIIEPEPVIEQPEVEADAIVVEPPVVVAPQAQEVVAASVERGAAEASTSAVQAIEAENAIPDPALQEEEPFVVVAAADGLGSVEAVAVQEDALPAAPQADEPQVAHEPNEVEEVMEVEPNQTIIVLE